MYIFLHWINNDFVIYFTYVKFLWDCLRNQYIVIVTVSSICTFAVCMPVTIRDWNGIEALSICHC